MKFRGSVLGWSVFALSTIAAAQQAETPLVVPAGVPLRLCLSKRVPKKKGAEVKAQVLDPVYAFDRQVIPVGAVVLGRVSSVWPVSKWQRTRAILGGDFTPLHLAEIEFTTLLMPDGHKIPLRTAESLGLNSLASSKQRAATSQNTGVLGTGKQQAKDAIQGQIERVKSIPSLVRTPDKKEKIEDYLMAKLPYHPQFVRKGTRFDADLLEPLSFGSEPVAPGALALVGTQPPPGSVVHARLITPLDSASSKQGQIVEAVLAEPVYSADHKLILPEGTHLKGLVVQARRARLFRRSGQLRFRFRDMELPEEVARLEAIEPAPAATAPPVQRELKTRTEAHLQAAESTGKGALKVDSEGGVQAKESKTRFLAAAASVLLARSAGDTDSGHRAVAGQNQNVGGRTIGGGFGFGMLGAGIAQSSKYVGSAFGYYGMAWSLYSTLIARGSEVQFGKDAMVDIRFDARSDEAAAHDATGGAARAAGRGPGH
jgi:hypothetical protein